MDQKIKTTEFQQSKPYNILVTGATGFIGSKLVEKLTERGYTVKAMSRQRQDDRKGVRFVKADAFNLDQLQNALAGVEVAFYLLHSMEGDSKHWKDFSSRETIQAKNFLKAATEAGVRRIIYLGGLVNDSLELSPHMRSRKKVGEILSSGKIPVTELRASLIIGAQGGSYAMLRYLVERLRFMVCPRWVKSLSQPIALDNVIDYLVGCMEKPETTGKIYDIGGPEKITYEDLMRKYSSYLNKNIFIVEIPFLTTRLSSYWVDLITPVKASLARPLIDSLVHDTIVENDSIKKIIPIRLKSVKESIDIATKESSILADNMSKEKRKGLVTNQKILMIILLAFAVCGTTYYWLDDRNDVYQPVWITASILWYGTLIFSFVFVRNQTRLGYLVAGILSWITFCFWLFDNLHIAFETSLISNEPSKWMTLRNFVGMAVAIMGITSSHNIFHKIRENN